MYNRRSRREIARKLGLSKEKTLQNDKSLTYNDLLKRSIDAGHQIHMSNIEETLNTQRKKAAEDEATQIKHLMEDTLDKNGKILVKGLTYEQALKIVEDNKRIEAARQEKLSKKNL